MTPSGIEPATFRLVAHWPNQQRHAVPPPTRYDADGLCAEDSQDFLKFVGSATKVGTSRMRFGVETGYIVLNVLSAGMYIGAGDCKGIACGKDWRR
jgi:hypothetical protein